MDSLMPMGPVPRPVIDRIVPRLVEGDVFEGLPCWLWTGALSSGYGRVDKSGRVHRIIWEFFNGKVPDGLDLDHLCRVRRCGNPWHLEPVTRSVNNFRRPKPERCRSGLHDMSDVYVNGNGRQCRPCVLERMRGKKWSA